RRGDGRQTVRGLLDALPVGRGQDGQGQVRRDFPPVLEEAHRLLEEAGEFLRAPLVALAVVDGELAGEGGNAEGGDGLQPGGGWLRLLAGGQVELLRPARGADEDDGGDPQDGKGAEHGASGR